MTPYFSNKFLVKYIFTYLSHCLITPPRESVVKFLRALWITVYALDEVIHLTKTKFCSLNKNYIGYFQSSLHLNYTKPFIPNQVFPNFETYFICKYMQNIFQVAFKLSHRKLELNS